MPAISAKESIIIDAPIETVFKTVRDFKKCPHWSPWVKVEPECEIIHAEDGSWYQWNGKVIGQGRLTVVEEEPLERIKYDLQFTAPNKMEAVVEHFFTKQGNGVEVTWTNEAKLPIFLFFLTKLFSALISSDYRRGLHMLKEYIESGEVMSELSFNGVEHIEGCQAVGLKGSSSIAQIGDTMKTDFEKLHRLFSMNRAGPAGPPFSIYHKWDMVKGKTDYTVGIPVKNIPKLDSSELISLEIPALDVYSITHTGKYDHLGNAWAAGMFRSRTRVFKSSRKNDPFELYLTPPDSKEVPKVKVCFPCKV